MNIAIIKLTAMGDIIQSAFVVQFIKKAFADANIDWFLEEAFFEVLEHNPQINLKPLNLKSIKKSKLKILHEIKKIKKYATKKYDFIIDMQALLKSAIVAKLLGKNTFGYDKNSAREKIAAFFYQHSFDIPYHLATSDRYRLLINKTLDMNITKEDILKKEPFLFYLDSHEKKIQKYLKKEKKNIVFIIGASWESKIYPKGLVQEVIDNLDANFIIPHSNKKEEEFVDSLKNVTKVKLNLNELKALISNADLVIGNDTGPTYMAWANNIPSIVLFGPVPPNRIYPDKKTILLKSPSKVDPYKLNKNDFSIKKIPPSKIIKAAKELL